MTCSPVPRCVVRFVCVYPMFCCKCQVYFTLRHFKINAQPSRLQVTCVPPRSTSQTAGGAPVILGNHCPRTRSGTTSSLITAAHPGLIAHCCIHRPHAAQQGQLVQWHAKVLGRVGTHRGSHLYRVHFLKIITQESTQASHPRTETAFSLMLKRSR